MSKPMISQIQLTTEILKVLGKQALNVRQINAVIEAANMIIRELEKPTTMAIPGMGLQAWLNSDDTGSSSLFMAHVLAGAPAVRCACPLDCGDFGRCVRFLTAVPVSLGIERMAKHGPVWAALVKDWDRLTMLYNFDSFYDVSEGLKKIEAENR